MATKEESLVEKINGLEIINLNGTTYLGNLEKTESGYTLKNAVEATENFEETVKNWIKSNNLNTLQELTCEGDGISVVKKSFTAKQKLEISIITAKAEYVIEYAIAELQNSKI